MELHLATDIDMDSNFLGTEEKINQQKLDNLTESAGMLTLLSFQG